MKEMNKNECVFQIHFYIFINLWGFFVGKACQCSIGEESGQLM